MNKRSQIGSLLIEIVIATLAVFVVAGVFLKVQLGKNGRLPGPLAKLNPVKASSVEQEGKKYAQGKCQGTDIKKLTHLPIDAENITNVLPYGGVVGAHVMPISHGYIWPGNQTSPRDAFNVYAMADSTLYYISSRSINVDTGAAKKTEYSLNFAVSCAEFYYYDLMTSLSPDLQKLIDEHPAQQKGGNGVQVNVQVKAGQLLGKIGAQTLDYAVWDFNKTLTGLAVADHYEGDYPRVHLVSPFDYMSDEVKKVMLSKAVRSVEPREGKVDYDIDGKLIGGWFEENSNYYTGKVQSRYWAGHLAILPDYIDPTFMEISIGSYGGNKEAQFGLDRSAPDPRTIGVESGLTKYDLYQIDTTKADGSMWDRFTPVAGLKAKTNGPSSGCAALQLTEARKLKAEFTPGHTCAEFQGFSAAAKVFTR